jgi:hypothetical protein
VGRDPEKIQEAVNENTGAVARWKVGDDIRRGLEWIEGEVRKMRGGDDEEHEDMGKVKD